MLFYSLQSTNLQNSAIGFEKIIYTHFFSVKNNNLKNVIASERGGDLIPIGTHKYRLRRQQNDGLLTSTIIFAYAIIFLNNSVINDFKNRTLKFSN